MRGMDASTAAASGDGPDGRRDLRGTIRQILPERAGWRPAGGDAAAEASREARGPGHRAR